MRIALVIGRYHALGGGAERWTDRHAQFLLNAGHEVHLVSRSFKNPPLGSVLHPVEHARGRLTFAQRAEDLLRRLPVDAVHDMGDGWFGDVFSPHHGTRAGGFEAGDGMQPAWRRPLRRLLRQWMPRYRHFQVLEDRQYAAGAFRTIVALSQRVKCDMMRYFGADPARIEVVYNGVDVEAFRPAEASSLRLRRDGLRRSWGWEDRVIFLLVAHNLRLKGLDALLGALARLRTRDVGLIVAGNDHNKPYRQLAERLGIAERVRFVGDQADAAPLFRAADVYVQPTFYDPCSLVVLEAMASGLPTITTAANGAGELLEHGRSGFVLNDPRDVPGLAELMEKTLDPAFRRTAGLAARRTAERCTMEANSRRYLELYQAAKMLSRAA